jgi:hypothetical protein
MIIKDTGLLGLRKEASLRSSLKQAFADGPQLKYVLFMMLKQVLL